MFKEIANRLREISELGFSESEIATIKRDIAFLEKEAKKSSGTPLFKVVKNPYNRWFLTEIVGYLEYTLPHSHPQLVGNLEPHHKRAPYEVYIIAAKSAREAWRSCLKAFDSYQLEVGDLVSSPYKGDGVVVNVKKDKVKIQYGEEFTKVLLDGRPSPFAKVEWVTRAEELMFDTFYLPAGFTWVDFEGYEYELKEEAGVIEAEITRGEGSLSFGHDYDGNPDNRYGSFTQEQIEIFREAHRKTRESLGF